MLTKTNAGLKGFVDRWSRLEQERLALAGDMKDVLEEAKSAGFTPSALKKAAKVHALDEKQRNKFDAEQGDFELYLAQLDGKPVE
jgi:uncharacterized protein (UPF0335 family)